MTKTSAWVLTIAAVVATAVLILMFSALLFISDVFGQVANDRLLRITETPHCRSPKPRRCPAGLVGLI